MNLTIAQRISILVKGSVAVAILVPMMFPFAILPEPVRDKFLDWLEQKLLSYCWLSCIFENLFLWIIILDEVLLDEDKSFWMLQHIASEGQPYTCPSVQKQLFALQLPEINSKLLKNSHLIPQLFSPLFLELQNRDKLLSLVRHNNFKYKNPITQALLDKMMLLL